MPGGATDWTRVGDETRSHTSGNVQRVDCIRLFVARDLSRGDMTASGGLQSDATLAVYEEDVVTYADDTTADEWGDGTNFSALAVGLVNRVPDSDKEDYSYDEGT